MLTSTDLYRQALPAPHRRETRVQVLHAGVVVADSDTGGIGVLEGSSVSASLTSRVTRTLDLVVDPGLYPETPDALLSPYIAVIKVWTGIGYPDGSREVFPVFTGRVQSVDEDAAGTVTVHAADLAQDVIGAQFETPMASVRGATNLSEIRRLIRGSIPAAVFGTDDVADQPTPTLVWDEDRGQALDDLAEACGGRWYALGDGTFVVREFPYTASTPVVTLADASGGVTLTATRSTTRTGVYNSVTVSSERMDGTNPVRVTIRQQGSDSPTRYGGPFGITTNIIKLQTPLNSSQSAQVAAAQLAASTALAEQWTINTTPDATLEPGDTIAVQYRGNSATQVVDTITYPLTTTGQMTLGTRSSIAATTVGTAQ